MLVNGFMTFAFICFVEIVLKRAEEHSIAPYTFDLSVLMTCILVSAYIFSEYDAMGTYFYKTSSSSSNGNSDNDEDESGKRKKKIGFVEYFVSLASSLILPSFMCRIQCILNGDCVQRMYSRSFPFVVLLNLFLTIYSSKSREMGINTNADAAKKSMLLSSLHRFVTLILGFLVILYGGNLLMSAQFYLILGLIGMLRFICYAEHANRMGFSLTLFEECLVATSIAYLISDVSYLEATKSQRNRSIGDEGSFSNTEISYLVELAIVSLISLLVTSNFVLYSIKIKFGQINNNLRTIVAITMATSVLVLVYLKAQQFIGCNPLLYLYKFFIIQSGRRLFIASVWIFLLIVGIPTSRYLAQAFTMPILHSRKLFHLLLTLICYPVLMQDARAVDNMVPFVSLALGGAFCVLLVLESLRIYLSSNDDTSRKQEVTHLQQIKRALNNFYVGFLKPDHCDLRILVKDHLTLILGCSIPIWFVLSVNPQLNECVRDGCRYYAVKYVGFWAVGIADSVSAIVGSTYGRTFWWLNASKRTLEGSCVALLLTIVFILLFHYLFFQSFDLYEMAIATLCMLGLTVVEAYTVEDDNLILPIYGCILYAILLI